MKGAKKPEKASTKESVQGSSSSSSKDKQDKHTQKPPAQQPSKEKEEEEAVKGSSKAVSFREKTVQVEVFSILILDVQGHEAPKGADEGGGAGFLIQGQETNKAVIREPFQGRGGKRHLQG